MRRPARPADALALVLAVLGPLAAGCLGGPPASGPHDVPGVPASEVTEGGYYAFTHAGGRLSFSLQGHGSADLELFGGDDVRLSRFGFGGDPGQSGGFVLDGVPAGEPVLRVLTLDGVLQVRSGDATVDRFRPLGALVERAVLVDRAPPQGPATPLLGGGPPIDPDAQPAEVQVAAAFRRAPSELRLLLAGVASDLHVEARSDRGVVLRAWANASSAPGAFGGGMAFQAIPVEVRPQAIRGGAFEVAVEARDLRGALVLEAHTFSRAPRPLPAEAGPALRDVGFTYGPLPADVPVQFAVRDRARVLYLWQNASSPSGQGTGQGAAGDAWVALYGPDDARLATVRVPAKGTVQVPVATGGEHVAVLLQGAANLGADAPPADFELHALSTRSEVLPASAAGGPQRRYGQAQEEAAGGAFRLRPASVQDAGGESLPAVFAACDETRLLRVEQRGEAVLSWTEPDLGQAQSAAAVAAAFAAATLALDAGPFTVVHDGFGPDGCQRPAVEAVAYVRRERAPGD